MPKEQRFEVRDLRDGDWYWIHKSFIREYARKIGAIGVAVYSFLAIMADSDQGCFPSQKYIGDGLGYSRATVNKALKQLEMNGLIAIDRTSRYHCAYHLLKVRCKTGETQVSTRGNSGVIYFDTNDNNITRNINNIDNDYKKISEHKKEFIPSTREELLASDLADALNDHKSLALYISYARRFSESLLRQTLGEVREIPEEQIRKSRAALFNHLIRKYDKTNKNYRD
jgi:biotin operon repressor